MYEICRFLSATTPKVRKARKPAAKRATIGAKVRAYGMEGEIIGKDFNGYPWKLRLVSSTGVVSEGGANRSAFDVI